MTIGYAPANRSGITMRTISFRCLSLTALMLSGIASASLQAAEGVVVEVAAGSSDREDALLSVELPPSLRDSRSVTLTQIDSGAQVPVQVDRSGTPRAVWILPRKLAAGQVERYRLAPADRRSAGEAVTVTNDEKQLSVRVGAKPVLVYHQAAVPPPDLKEPCYARSGQIHPVYNPSGQVVTDDMNHEHTHQHGIMFAWRKSSFEGNPSDCWDQKGGQGRIEHMRTEAVGGGPVFGFFTVRLRHSSLTAAKPMLDETWCVRVYNRSDCFVFDLESVQTCAGSSPLVVQEYSYGGMAIRGSAAWMTRKPPFDYLTNEGKGREGNHSRPNWVDFFGPLEGHTTGILVMDNPGNFRYPQPVRLHPTIPYFCFAPAVLGDFAIEPGKPYVSKYRFCVHDNQLTVQAADRLWQDYADPPQVRVLAVQ